MTMSSSSPRTPDRTAIQKTACHCLQSRSVSVESLGGYIFWTYRLRTAEGFFYILRCRPTFNVRLLRHEQSWLETEAGVLQSLARASDIQPPRLITYHGTPAHIGSMYLISGPFSGSILADIEPSLSPKALASIDKSLGHYVRRVASITGSKFGPFMREDLGSSSWAKMFAFLLEAIMRDGEDSLVSLPYEGIRDLVRRHRSSLDQITQPRLVLLEISSDRNVVVDAKSSRVTGVLDFSTALWGDPFMSDCFCTPTASFVEGFGRLPNKTADECVRQYFYVLYHSLLAIVRQSYRPKDGGGDEMDARRTLTTAMKQLSNA